MKILKKVISLSLVLLILAVFFLSETKAYAGVSPGKYEVNFEPGQENIFQFEFFGGTDTKLEIYAEGDLADYVTLSKKEVIGKDFVNVLLEFPNKINVPGQHTLYIGAREKKDDQGGITLIANVRGIILVNVPYPGKYATMSFNIEDANIGEPIKVNIKIDSLGDEEIQANSFILIYDEAGKRTQKIDLEKFSLKKLETKEIEYFLNTSSYKAGKYNAEAVVEYDGGVLRETKPFRLGELLVLIKGYTKYIYREQINKFDVDIESQWNDPLDNVYGVVEILGHPISFKTPSVVLEGFGSANLTGYFDTTSIGEEKLTARIMVFYEDKMTDKFVTLKFKKEIDYMLVLIISVISIFIIIIIWLIVWIKKLNKVENGIRKQKKKH